MTKNVLFAVLGLTATLSLTACNKAEETAVEQPASEIPVEQPLQTEAPSSEAVVTDSAAAASAEAPVDAPAETPATPEAH